MNPLLIRFVLSVATVVAVDLYKEGKYVYKKKRAANKFKKALATGEKPWQPDFKQMEKDHDISEERLR